MAVQRWTSADIRSESRRDVMRSLLTAKEASRNQLARETGLSPATVATVVAELLSEGIISEGRVTAGRIGRPTTTLQINPDRGRVVGVDVAETYLRAAVFDAALDQIAFVDVLRDQNEHTSEYVSNGVLEAIGLALERSGTDHDQVLGVGLALPGIVVGPSGTSDVLPGWDWTTHAIRDLCDRIGFPTVLDNPLKSIAAAEFWFGEAQSLGSFVTINLGTGVGAGIVLDGHVLRGSTNSAGEWGHSLLVLDGRACRCGRRGCVEAYVGAPGIQQTVRDIDPTHPLADIPLQQGFIKGLADGLRNDIDPVASETLSRTARYLGSAIADLVAIINPDLVALTGWTAWAIGDLLLVPTRETLVREAPGNSGADVQLTVSTVRGNSVAIGAALGALLASLEQVGLVTSRTAVIV